MGDVNIDRRAYTDIDCCVCGVVFYVPKQWDSKKQENGESFWCPNGHQQSYSESTTVKLRRERDRLKQRLAEKDDHIARERDLREAAERKASAQKGQVTKLKKRAAGGACPCCNRHFQNLQSHMANKHPDFVKSDAA